MMLATMLPCSEVLRMDAARPGLDSSAGEINHRCDTQTTVTKNLLSCLATATDSNMAVHLLSRCLLLPRQD